MFTKFSKEESIVLTKQATKAVLNILKYQKSFCHFAPDEAFTLFDSLVLPILCYLSEIWGYDYSETIEKVRVDFCKRVCCLHQNICNFLAISECGGTPISIVYMSRCVKYWSILTQMQNHRYPKQRYNMLRNLDNMFLYKTSLFVNCIVYMYSGPEAAYYQINQSINQINK